MINLLIPAITGLLDKVIPDKDEREKLAHEIATMAQKQAHESVMAQVKVNEVQAAHKSLFVAGARPAIMWICALGLFYAVFAHPILDIFYDMPEVNTDVLMPVMMGLLGLGGMRSFEKSKGVAREK
jgi:hypothetical protein